MRLYFVVLGIVVFALAPGSARAQTSELVRQLHNEAVRQRVNASEIARRRQEIHAMARGPIELGPEDIVAAQVARENAAREKAAFRARAWNRKHHAAAVQRDHPAAAVESKGKRKPDH